MNNPLVIIVRNASATDFGGGERFPIFLASGLKTRYRAVVVSRSDKLLRFAKANSVESIRGLWWSRQNWSSWRVLLIPLYGLWQTILFVWYLQLFMRMKPTVIHIQSKDDFIAATIAGKVLKSRVIWTDHADLKHIWKNICIWYKNPVGKLVYLASKLADTITVVSRSEMSLVSENLPLHDDIRKKIIVVYNGVFDNKQDYTLVQRGDNFTFCAASRLVKDKGIFELTESFKNILIDHPNSNLLVLGDGPDRKDLAIEHPKIKFMGHVEDPLKYISMSNVFVHPTYHEGFSVALVEACMLERAIIATNVGGNPEIIIDEITGLLVEARNVPDLTRAMKRLINDSELTQRLSANARNQYVNKFSFNEIIKSEFIPLYEKNSN